MVARRIKATLIVLAAAAVCAQAIPAGDWVAVALALFVLVLVRIGRIWEG